MIAHDQMVKGRKDLLIVILKEKINVDKLPADLRVYIRKFVHISLFVIHGTSTQEVRMHRHAVYKYGLLQSHHQWTNSTVTKLFSFQNDYSTITDRLLTDFNLDLELLTHNT